MNTIQAGGKYKQQMSPQDIRSTLGFSPTGKSSNTVSNIPGYAPIPRAIDDFIRSFN